jgi:ribosomal protein S18 acetylase RimI-like enzyme
MGKADAILARDRRKDSAVPGPFGRKQASVDLWQDASSLLRYLPTVAEVRLSSIRRARHDDAARLSAIAERTFRKTFAAVNTPEDMDLHCRTRYGPAIQAEEIADPNRVTLLCEDGARLVGFAQLRWGAAPSCVAADAPGEIQRLYVVGDFHGKGVAHELMNACMDEIAAHGADVAWLGVWERNPKAIAFYRKFGFREVGEHAFSLGRDRQRDIVMARPVAGSRSEAPQAHRAGTR